MTEATYTQLSAYTGGCQVLFSFNNQILGNLVTIKASTNKISKEAYNLKHGYLELLSEDVHCISKGLIHLNTHF